MPSAIVFILIISIPITFLTWLIALSFGVTINVILLYVVVVIVVFILIRILG